MYGKQGGSKKYCFLQTGVKGQMRDPSEEVPSSYSKPLGLLSCLRGWRFLLYTSIQIQASALSVLLDFLGSLKKSIFNILSCFCTRNKEQ